MKSALCSPVLLPQDVAAEVVTELEDLQNSVSLNTKQVSLAWLVLRERQNGRRQRGRMGGGREADGEEAARQKG